MSISNIKNNKFLIYGILDIIFFTLLAVYHIIHGQAYLILWCCHLGCLFVGLGVLFRYPALNGAGFLWLCFGAPIWIMTVLLGDELILLSIPTHFGGIIIGAWGMKQFGIPRFTWAAASLGLLALGFLCRYTTPVHANLNISHSVWPGWEDYFTSHVKYVIFVHSISTVSYFIIEYVSRWALKLLKWSNKEFVKA